MSSGPNTGRKPSLPEYQQAVGRVLRPGTRSLVMIDLTSVEARIVATTTSPVGPDLYRARAAELFGVSPEAVTPEQRRFAKNQMYAEIYSPKKKES